MSKTNLNHELRDDKLLITIEGDIDKKWPNDVKLFKEKYSQVSINCDGIKSISYCGFDNFYNFIQRFPSETFIDISHLPECLINILNSTDKTLNDNISFSSFYVPLISKKTNDVVKKLFYLYDVFDFEHLTISLPTIKENNQTYHPLVTPFNYLNFLPEVDVVRYSKYNDLYDPIFILNENKRLIYANRKAAELMETPFKRILKRKFICEDVISFKNDSFFESKQYETTEYRNCKGTKGDLSILAIQDKANFPLRKRKILFANPILDSRDAEKLYHLQHQSPTDTVIKLQESRKNLDEFNDFALTDRLTGLYNYIAFTKELSKELARAIRHEHSFGLIIFDIDNFKKFNDQHGNQQGDEAIKVLVKALAKCLRKSDYFARYGGEEFVIIAPQTQHSGIKTLMEKCRITVENCKIPSLSNAGESLNLTASFGGVFIEYSKISIIYDIKTFIEQADRNLYRAKEQNKNCSVLTDYELI